MSYKKVAAAKEKLKKLKEKPVQHLFDGGLSLPAAGSFDGGSGSGFGGGGGGGGMPDFSMPGGGGGYNLPQPVWDPSNWTKQNFPSFAGSQADSLQHQLTPNPFGGGVHNHFSGVTGVVNPLTGNPAVSADFTNSNNIGVQQQALAQQLAAQANGQMSPAQMMLQNQLRQNTNNNNMQNASMLGSVKGLNPAIAARLASQNAASSNQQAGGQAANLALGLQGQSQQQLGGLLHDWRGQDLETELGGARIGLENRGQNIQGTNGYNNTLTQGQLGTAGIQKDYDIQQMKGQQGMFGGGLNALGGLLSMPYGGSLLSKILPGGGPGGGQPEGPNGDQTPTESGNGSAAPSGGEWAGSNFAGGGIIPGDAPFPGDDVRNDKVEKNLSPGEIVLPRSITEHPDAPHLAYEFVRKTLAGKGPKPTYKMADGGPVQMEGVGDGPVITDGEPAEQPAAPDPSDPATWAAQGAAAGEGARHYLFRGTPLDNAPAPAPTDQPGLEAPAGKTDALALVDHELAKEPRTNPNAMGLPPLDAAGTDPKAAPTAGNPALAGLGMMERGAQNIADAQSQEAYDRSIAAGDYTAKMQKLETDRQMKTAALDAENQKLTQAVMSAKIDPNRVFANMSTGGKISAAIGMALSGIGSGLTGQPNMAMNIINKSIDNDIEAQRADLGNKHTLLSMNLQKYGRLDAAYAATSAQMHAVLEGQVMQAAANAGGPEAQARAMMTKGQLEQQRGALQSQAATLAAFNQPSRTPGVDVAKLNLGIHAKIIPEAEAVKEYGEYQKLTGQMGAVNDAFRRVAKAQELGNRLGNPIQAGRQIDAATLMEADKLARDLTGRVNDSSMNAMKANFPQFGDDAATLKDKRRNLENAVKSAYSFPNLTRFRIINPNDPSITGSTGIQGARTMQAGQ